MTGLVAVVLIVLIAAVTTIILTGMSMRYYRHEHALERAREHARAQLEASTKQALSMDKVRLKELEADQE